MIAAWFAAVDEIAGNEHRVLQGEKAQKARFEPVGCRELKKDSHQQSRTVDMSWLTTARFTTTTCIHVDASGIRIITAILLVVTSIFGGFDGF
jgi:hypothetical protein